MYRNTKVNPIETLKASHRHLSYEVYLNRTTRTINYLAATQNGAAVMIVKKQVRVLLPGCIALLASAFICGRPGSGALRGRLFNGDR